MISCQQKVCLNISMRVKFSFVSKEPKPFSITFKLATAEHVGSNFLPTSPGLSFNHSFHFDCDVSMHSINVQLPRSGKYKVALLTLKDHSHWGETQWVWPYRWECGLEMIGCIKSVLIPAEAVWLISADTSFYPLSH